MPGLRRDDPDEIEDGDVHIVEEVLQFVPPERTVSFSGNIGEHERKVFGMTWKGRQKSTTEERNVNSSKGIAGFVASHFGTANGSAESEHDLGAMVHDFLENGSCGTEFNDSSDSDNGVCNMTKLFETLQALKYSATSTEKELLSALTLLFLSIKETDLICLKTGTECKGGCIRRLLVKHLRISGFNAAVCNSRWPSSGKVPGGEELAICFLWWFVYRTGRTFIHVSCLVELILQALLCSTTILVSEGLIQCLLGCAGEYEYIDVEFKGDNPFCGRLIVDIDFQSQFEIARPTHAYISALKSLPVIFVGALEKLEQILRVMAEAGKISLKQNSMPFPPWRTLEYMCAKWMSPYERENGDIQCDLRRGPCSLPWRERTRTKQCVEQLRHLKMCLAAETDRNYYPKATVGERNGRTKLKEYRRHLTLVS